MQDIIKAVPDDFERVYPLLMEFHNPRITREAWKRIFNPPWDTGEDYCGYLLVDGDKVEGFFGYLFGRNPIDGKLVRFCNLTSWYVYPDYRGRSIEMLYPLMKLKDCVLTDFSPADNVLKMLVKRYKFSILEQALSFVYPVPGLSRAGCRVYLDGDLPAEMLNPKDTRIHQDHRSLNVRHILVESDQGYCYIVGRNRRFRKVRYLQLLYISDPVILAAHSGPVLRAICLRYLVFGAMVENRLLRGCRFPLSYSIRPFKTTIYRTSLDIDPADITQLYSEKVLL